MRRYRDIPITTRSPIKPGVRAYTTVKYPEIPLSVSDIYVITQKGDRFDLLANQYYSDKSLWWIISIANNNLIQNSLIPPVGIQIRIPTNVGSILNSYKKLNR
jgi:phage tail protein X